MTTVGQMKMNTIPVRPLLVKEHMDYVSSAHPDHRHSAAEQCLRIKGR